MEYSNEANQSELQGFYMNKIRKKKTLPRGKIFGRWCRGKINKTTENNRAVTGFLWVTHTREAVCSGQHHIIIIIIIDYDYYC